MAENLIIAESADREARYRQLIPQLESLTSGEPDLIANLANVVAAIRQTFGFFWIGFYLVRDNELVLGPFQGPIACTRIGLGKGVCGTSWKEKKTIVVPDVDLFPGHIACSSDSKSEIVIPCTNKNGVFAILDIDSDKLADFDETDKKYLHQIVKIIEHINYV
jgi:GAF domain-containing protein